MPTKSPRPAPPPLPPRDKDGTFKRGPSPSPNRGKKNR